jgi:PAS domain S-box-containing protein
MIGDRAGTLLELLVQINRELASAVDLRTVLHRLTFAAMQHVGGERGSIIVLDDMGKSVEATMVYGTSLHEHTTRQLKETMDRGLAGWVVRNRKPALVPDTSLDERWVRRPDDAQDRTGPKSAICVPLVARERLVGVLTLVHSMPNAFGPEHLELTKAIADQASIAVLNARLYSESSRQARIMTALADGAVAFSSSLNVQEVWQRVLNQTIQALQVETAAIGLLEGPERGVVFRAATGLNAGKIVSHRIAGGQGLVGQVVREGNGIVIANASEDTRFSSAERVAGIDVRAIALAPIQAQGKIIGILEAINPVSHTFDPDALTVMMGLGGLAGTTSTNARLFEALQKAHQRYRELFDESIDPMVVTDWEGRILEASRQAVRVSGFTMERLNSMRIDELHEVDWGKVGPGFTSVRDGRKTYESFLHKADASRVAIEVYARPVEFEETKSILWTLRDLTERKELDAVRRDLTSMIYHDLRSPLGNVVSSLSLLDGMIGKEGTARSTLDIAVHSTERMHRLVDSLLDINRLESGQPLTAQTATRPEDLIQKACLDVTPAATGRNQAIRIRIEKQLPDVWVDGDMMRRVLINLLENAVKFSKPEGEIEVGVEFGDGSRDL